MSRSIKKQFRLYDIYRYATVSEMSKIEGITSYEVDSIASTIYITYDGGDITTETHYAASESDLKEIVRHINHRLGNCSKPGVRKGTHRRVRPKSDKVWTEYEAEKAKIAATSKDYNEYERRVAQLATKLGI